MSIYAFREFARSAVRSVFRGVVLGSVFGAFQLVIAYSPNVTPDYEPESDSVGGQKKVCTEFGTYRIRAPKPMFYTKEEHYRLCQRLVQRYEKETHNTWGGLLSDGPFIKRVCGISLDDIRNNIRGYTNN